ncbi:MAG: hypothetical protein AAB758_02905, partial [Patescibacteria group bacterium]
FDVLHELQKVDKQAIGCPFIAHAISRAETQKNPSKWKEIMNAAPGECSYGAAHGALEVYASTFPDGKLPKNEIPNLCNNPDGNNCTHGLGHLLLVLNENNIPEALKDCERLPHNSFGKFECFTGVFMERSTASNLVIHGLATEEALNWSPEKLPELESLCRDQTGVYAVACWKETAHVAAVALHNDMQKVLEFCEKAQSEEAARQCIDHSFGIIGASYHFELSRMSPICEARAKAQDFKNRCYANLVSATLSTIPREVPATVKFCGNISETYRKACFTTIGNSLYLAKQEYKDLLAKECAKAPDEFKARCEQGGDSEVIFYAGT